LTLWYLPLSLVIIGIWPHALSRYFRVTAVAKPLYLRAVRVTSCTYRILTGMPAEPTEFWQCYQLLLPNFHRTTSYTYRILTGLPATPNEFSQGY